MITIFSKTNKIRLVGLSCSRDYLHEFAHYIDLIIEVTIFRKSYKLSILFQLKSIETFLMRFIGWNCLEEKLFYNKLTNIDILRDSQGNFQKKAAFVLASY